jgi:MoaA/NifB/PqqE/SkfB family radical SAM enzyme
LPCSLKALRVAARVPKLEITLCTNATLFSDRHAALLKDVGAKVNISVDGDERFHDHFRSFPGAFRSTELGLRRAVEAGILATVVTTISRANLHLLPFMVEWAASFGAVQFRAQPLLRLGRGNGISEQCLTNHEMDRLLLQLTDLANAYRSRGLKCNVVGASRSFLRKHPCGAYVCNGSGCHRRVAQEIKKLVIREDGTILPEITNLSHEFAIGNIEDGPLSTLVNLYFEEGYRRFDQLCRATYAEVLSGWDSEYVPWIKWWQREVTCLGGSLWWRSSRLIDGSCGQPARLEPESAECAVVAKCSHKLPRHPQRKWDSCGSGNRFLATENARLQ